MRCIYCGGEEGTAVGTYHHRIGCSARAEADTAGILAAAEQRATQAEARLAALEAVREAAQALVDKIEETKMWTALGFPHYENETLRTTLRAVPPDGRQE